MEWNAASATISPRKTQKGLVRGQAAGSALVSLLRIADVLLEEGGGERLLAGCAAAAGAVQQAVVLDTHLCVLTLLPLLFSPPGHHIITSSHRFCLQLSKVSHTDLLGLILVGKLR